MIYNPTRPRRPTAALDTSALSDLLNDADLRRRFVKAVRRQRAAVLVSEMVIFEFSSDADVPGVTSRLLALKALCRELPSSLWITPDHKGLMRREGVRLVLDPPLRTIGWREFAALSDAKIAEMATKLPDSYNWLQNKKDDFLEADRGLHKFLSDQRGQVIVPEDVAAEIEKSSPPRPDEMIIEQAADLSGGRFTAEQIAGNAKRFRTAHALSHWVWRLQLGNSADPDKCRGAPVHVLGMWRTKPGDKGRGAWYDAFIAAGAAYADELLTADTDQARRAAFLFQRGLVKFRAGDLAAFIG